MNVVIIANAWQAGRDNPTSKHRIAVELARRGHRVLWIEGAGMRAPSLGSGADRGRIFRRLSNASRGAQKIVNSEQWAVNSGEKDEGLRSEICVQRAKLLHRSITPTSQRSIGSIWVLSPPLIPLPRFDWVRRVNGWLCARAAQRHARRLGMSDPVLINYVPILGYAMRSWHRAGRMQVTDNCLTVYHCVDRWDAFRMYDARVMAAMDRLCCEQADLVIASSQVLHERCSALNRETHLVTHGVDYEHFASALLSGIASPTDLPPPPRVVFIGLLSEWVDQDLLVTMARELPRINLILIGRADVPVTRLAAESNIHMLGPRSFASLPGYLAGATAGIIPFLVNDLTRAVNPIKLREMLAAGCPVVSTALPEAAVFEGRGVDVTQNAADFIRKVSARVAHSATREERLAISAGMAGETWRAKVDRILELMAAVSG